MKRFSPPAALLGLALLWLIASHRGAAAQGADGAGPTPVAAATAAPAAAGAATAAASSTPPPTTDNNKEASWEVQLTAHFTRKGEVTPAPTYATAPGGSGWPSGFSTWRSRVWDRLNQPFVAPMAQPQPPQPQGATEPLVRAFDGYDSSSSGSGGGGGQPATAAPRPGAAELAAEFQRAFPLGEKLLKAALLVHILGALRAKALGHLHLHNHMAANHGIRHAARSDGDRVYHNPSADRSEQRRRAFDQPDPADRRFDQPAAGAAGSNRLFAKPGGDTLRDRLEDHFDRRDDGPEQRFFIKPDYFEHHRPIHPVIDPSLAADTACLLELKGAMLNPPPDIAELWRPGSNPCRSRWPYVTCTEDMQAVETIELAGLFIRMVQLPELVPSSLAWAEAMRPPTDRPPRGSPLCFQRLKAIILRNNAIAGSLPTNWATLPSLRLLDLSGNVITGVLPAPWLMRQSWDNLEKLLLSNNVLQGPLPECPTDCFSRLDELSLKQNSINGSLPATWSRGFVRLVGLDISHNDLEGGLPQAWGSGTAWQGLITLDLSHNMLSGPLPDSWGGGGAFSHLRYLSLTVNRLGDPANEGPLPIAWTRPNSFPNLQNMVLFPGNSLICTPGTPDRFTNVVGGFHVGYSVVDMYFSVHSTDFLECY